MTTLSERDLDSFREALEAAAEEHADRAVSALLADLEFHLQKHEADAIDNPTRQWAACLLVRTLARKIKR